MTKPLRILVTGGSGFIGTHLCEKLVESGYAPRVIDIRGPAHPIKSVSYHKVDIRNFHETKQYIKDSDVVFHLAAEVSVPICERCPVESYQTNLMGTIHILHAIRTCNLKRKNPIRMIFASSAAVYGLRGRKSKPIKEEYANLWPFSHYAAQKLDSEQAIRRFYDNYGLPAIVLRFFNVYGPGQVPDSPYSGVITVFHHRLANGKSLSLHGGGNQTRDFVFVKDVADACYQSLLAPAKLANGRAFNVGTGKTITIKKLALTMMKALDRQVPMLVTDPREGDIPYSQSDITRTKKVLKWTPRIKLDEGIRTLLDSLEYSTEALPKLAHK